MQYKLIKTDTKTNARLGEITTDHGTIQTPIFMPVGTVGSVKGIHQRDVSDDIHAQIILGNTYHLYLRPGPQLLQQAGGLHKFMHWDKPILTDSGGFQVFSLSANRKLTEEGAKFSSHIDGSKHLFTPEKVVDLQRIIGSDIMMAFDECPPGDCDYNYARKSLDLTMRWLHRGVERYKQTEPLYGHYQSFFPIVQGASFKELRQRSATEIAELGMDGNAIGGLAVGEPVEVMYAMIEVVNEILPTDKPRYLMGVGTPANILEGISRGVDMFDCVMPTRNGRNGMLFTSEGIMNMKNNKWKDDFSPIDPCGASFVDLYYSKAYLRHLFVSEELLAGQIASAHNLAFYLWLVGEARKHIAEGDFAEWKEMMVKKVTTRL
ncbi:MAG: tRNA guanosine(34) transglycosylase Tgt [Salinivirgaceae bacterium]|nr:tRNA guanosine(34) transglycosylase Tgt [Salinivirgaceae bacterium]